MCTHTHTHKQASRGAGGKVRKVAARGVSSRGGRWQGSVTREEEEKEHPNAGLDVPEVSSRGVSGGRLRGSSTGARGVRRRTIAESGDEGRVFVGSADALGEDDVTFGEDDVGVQQMVEAANAMEEELSLQAGAGNGDVEVGVGALGVRKTQKLQQEFLRTLEETREEGGDERKKRGVKQVMYVLICPYMCPHVCVRESVCDVSLHVSLCVCLCVCVCVREMSLYVSLCERERGERARESERERERERA